MRSYRRCAPPFPPADDIIRQHGISNIQLRHVQADPRRRAALAAAVDVGHYSAALILADDLWQTGAGAALVGPEVDGASALLAAVPSSGGSRSLHEALRMDASVLGVQLNLRMLLAVGAAACRWGTPAVAARLGPTPGVRGRAAVPGGGEPRWPGH
jgi:hypothetical protein